MKLLQLSNRRVKEEYLLDATPLQQWSYFLLRAEKLTMDEIKGLLPDEVFSEAASVLDVVAKTPEQRRRYEARLKFQRDEAARAITSEKLASKVAWKELTRESKKESRKESKGVSFSVESRRYKGWLELRNQLARNYPNIATSS